jgi:hypothetical protein
MRAVQITRFGGPEVLDVVDLPDPTPGEGQQLYDVSTAGVNYADTHQPLAPEAHQNQDAPLVAGPGALEERRGKAQLDHHRSRVTAAMGRAQHTSTTFPPGASTGA